MNDVLEIAKAILEEYKGKVNLILHTNKIIVEFIMIKNMPEDIYKSIELNILNTEQIKAEIIPGNKIIWISKDNLIKYLKQVEEDTKKELGIQLDTNFNTYTLIDFFKFFDIQFNANTSILDIEQYPLLNKIYETMGENIYAVNRKYKELMSKANYLYNELAKIIPEDKLNQLTDFIEAEEEESEITRKQIFVFGYALCLEEMKELGIII